MASTTGDALLCKKETTLIFFHSDFISPVNQKLDDHIKRKHMITSVDDYIAIGGCKQRTHPKPQHLYNYRTNGLLCGHCGKGKRDRKDEYFKPQGLENTI